MVFAIGVALLTAVALGVVTAARASKQEIRDTLTEGTRSVAGGRTSERVRQGLVVAQVALTIMLLVGAGLLTRSFVRLLSIDPGYRTDEALVVDLSWPFDRDDTIRQRRTAVQSEILARLQSASRRDQRVGLVSPFPLGTAVLSNGQFLEMTRPDEITSVQDVARLGTEVKTRAGFAGYRTASEGYFADDGYSAGARTAVRRSRWSRRAACGAHQRIAGGSEVAESGPARPLHPVRQHGRRPPRLHRDRRRRRRARELARGAARAALLRQLPAADEPALQCRASRSAQATSLAPTVRQVIRELDPSLPVQVRSVDEALDRAVAGRRFSLTLIAVFSVAALVLATLGIYGLISYLVAERTREIGIRLALGAASGDVLRMVVGRGALLAASGMLVGLAASLGLTGLLKGMLFGVTATDPVAFLAVIAVTMAAVLGASYVPARRALKVAPVTALRGE